MGHGASAPTAPAVTQPARSIPSPSKGGVRELPDRESAQQELGRVRHARRTEDGLHHHRLRQRRRRNVSGVAWSADLGALGI